MAEKRSQQAEMTRLRCPKCGYEITSLATVAWCNRHTGGDHKMTQMVPAKR